MADTEALLLAELQKLNRTVSAQGSMGGGSELKGGAAPASAKDVAEKESDRQSSVARKIQKSLSKSSNAHIAAISATMDSMEKLRTLAEANSKKDLDAFMELRRQYRSGGVDIGDYRDKIKELGFTTKDVKRSEEELRAEMDELTDTVGNLDEKMDEAAERSGKVSRVMAALAAIAGAAAKELYAVHTTSMRTGLEETLGQAAQARLMGMSQVELLETQANYRQTMEASGMTSEKMTALMKDQGYAMIGLTGSIKDGAKFALESARSFRVLGAAGMDQSQFLEGQKDVFRSLHNTLSMTTEQFIAMNEQLLSSQSIRAQMFKMDKSRRAQYFLEIQQTMEKLRLDGLTIEQAHKVVEAMEAMGAKSPRERLKEAAKLQATMGGMGMGAEGERAAQLLRGGLRGEGDKAEFAELMKQATARSSEIMGQGFASEMAQSQLLATSGMDQYIGPMGQFADTALAEGLKVNPAQQSTADNTAATSEAVQNATIAYEVAMNAMTEGPLATIITSLGVIVGTLVTGQALMTTLLGSGSLMLSRLAMIGKGLGAVGLAAGVGYGIGTAIDSAWEKNAPDSRRAFSDWLGSSVDSTLAFFGNEAAQDRLDIMRTLNEDKESAETAEAERTAYRGRNQQLLQDQLDEQRRANDIAEGGVAATQQTTRVVAQTSEERAAEYRASTQNESANRRSINIRARGRAGATR